MKGDHKTTNCDYEYVINYKYIMALNENETRVPLKICSFDIEASSSHGDFPVPVKSYKKLATNIIEYLEKHWAKGSDTNTDRLKAMLRDMVSTAFGYGNFPSIDI